MKMQAWTQLPTSWILSGGLKNFLWQKHRGDGTIALLLLLVIAQHVNAESGRARLTYSDFETILGYSRTKIADGLDLLEKMEIVKRRAGHASQYQILGDEKPWGKIPARPLYSRAERSLTPFKDFSLRKKAELDALKIYFLFVARRSNETNTCALTYQQISDWGAVPRERIKTALTMLYGCGLVYVERQASNVYEDGVSNLYRLAHIDPYSHEGTQGRSASAA